MAIVSVQVKQNGRVITGNPNKHDSKFPVDPYTDIFKVGGLLITWMPRYIAAQLPSGANVISIEYFDNERPKFDEGVNVLPLINSMGCYNKNFDEILDWVEKTCNGNPIFVHCEMGMIRSKVMAREIEATTHYKSVQKIFFVSSDGEVIHHPARL